MDNETLRKRSEEKIDTLDSSTIEELGLYLKKVNKNVSIGMTIFFGISTLVFLIVFLVLLLKGSISAVCIVFMLISLTLTIASLVLRNSDKNKSNKDVVIEKYIADYNANREFKVILKDRTIILDNVINTTPSYFDDKDFIISKMFYIKNKPEVAFYVDSENKKFCFCLPDSWTKIYEYKDLLKYEIYENGSSVVQGCVGKALIGGAFFGLGGLILGSASKREVSQYCNNLSLYITINDIENNLIKIDVINNAIDKSSETYQNEMIKLKELCSLFELITSHKE